MTDHAKSIRLLKQALIDPKRSHGTSAQYAAVLMRLHRRLRSPLPVHEVHRWATIDALLPILRQYMHSSKKFFVAVLLVAPRPWPQARAKWLPAFYELSERLSSAVVLASFGLCAEAHKAGLCQICKDASKKALKWAALDKSATGQVSVCNAVLAMVLAGDAAEPLSSPQPTPDSLGKWLLHHRDLPAPDIDPTALFSSEEQEQQAAQPTGPPQDADEDGEDGGGGDRAGGSADADADGSEGWGPGTLHVAFAKVKKGCVSC